MPECGTVTAPSRVWSARGIFDVIVVAKVKGMQFTMSLCLYGQYPQLTCQVCFAAMNLLVVHCLWGSLFRHMVLLSLCVVTLEDHWNITGQARGIRWHPVQWICDGVKCDNAGSWLSLVYLQSPRCVRCLFCCVRRLWTESSSVKPHLCLGLLSDAPMRHVSQEEHQSPAVKPSTTPPKAETPVKVKVECLDIQPQQVTSLSGHEGEVCSAR